MSFRGPRQGFTESLQTNISMIRRYIKNPNLWVEKNEKGSVTNTDIALMYIQGICDEKVLKEVKQRLEKIDIDSILESGYIEQLIEDETFTTFPTMYHTERPDVVAGNLLEGRFAIIVDGTPFVLIAPALFVQFFQSVEDYYSRFDIATSIRILRVLVFFISLVAPAVYVAATTFHQEMIPTQLLVVIAAQREIVPFPAVVEALTMEVAFEILREAGSQAAPGCRLGSVNRRRARNRPGCRTGWYRLSGNGDYRGTHRDCELRNTGVCNGDFSPAYSVYLYYCLSCYGFLRADFRDHYDVCPLMQSSFIRRSIYVAACTFFFTRRKGRAFPGSVVGR